MNIETFLVQMIVPVVVAFLSSSGVGAIVLYILKRRDKTEDITKALQEQKEGIAVLTEGFSFLLDTLHEKKIINGESEHIRKDFNRYLLQCVKNNQGPESA